MLNMPAGITQSAPERTETERSTESAYTHAAQEESQKYRNEWKENKERSWGREKRNSLRCVKGQKKTQYLKSESLLVRNQIPIELLIIAGIKKKNSKSSTVCVCVSE